MTDPEGLLDTSTLLLLPLLTDAAVLPDVPLISAITLAELSVGPLVTDDDAERAPPQEPPSHPLLGGSPATRLERNR